MFLVSIPRIGDDELKSRYARIKPVVTVDGRIWGLREYSLKELKNNGFYNSRGVDKCHLIPEEKFDLEEGKNAFLPKLFDRLQRRHHAVVIVAEGAGQELIQGNREKDKSGNILHQNIGLFLKDKIKEYSKKVGIEATIKYFDPTYTIRGIPANGTDAVFCLLLGQNAVHAAMAGCTDMVVGHWNESFTHVPIPMAVRERKKIDTNGSLISALRLITNC